MADVVKKQVEISTLEPSVIEQSVLFIEKIADSMRNVEFWEEYPPIIVDQDGWVLDGHHRFRAAQDIGIETLPALVVNRQIWDSFPTSSLAYEWACNEVGDDRALLDFHRSHSVQEGAAGRMLAHSMTDPTANTAATVREPWDMQVNLPGGKVALSFSRKPIDGDLDRVIIALKMLRDGTFESMGAPAQ